MMMHPDYSYERHVQRREELIRAVRIEQLARRAYANRADLPRRLMLILSDAMIGGGVRLKRYARGTGLRPLSSVDSHLELLPRR